MTSNTEKSQTKGHREADFAFLGKFNGEGKSDLDYEKDSVNLSRAPDQTNLAALKRAEIELTVDR
jgi:hypothetical protein